MVAVSLPETSYVLPVLVIFFSNAAIAGHQRELNLKLFHIFGSGPDLKSMAKIWGSLLVRRGAQSCLFSVVFFSKICASRLNAQISSDGNAL